MALKAATGLEFEEQLAALRKRLANLVPTERWTDMRGNAHDRAFTVAGAMKADLLADLAKAVERALVEHKGLDDFRKHFDAIVARHGWAYVGERNWRTRVIYETNLLTSYAAGRMAQLKDPKLLKIAPYWRYVHNDSVITPRPHHKRWGDMRLTLPHDHPFWSTHYPPNGWGCRCRVVAERAPKGADAVEPPEGWDAIDPKTGAPVGIDKGWGHAPGATVQDELRALVQDKAAKLPGPLGRALEADVASFLHDPFKPLENTNMEFAQAVHDTYDALPEVWRNAVAEAGYQVQITRRLTEALPRLAGLTPRGGAPGETWDARDGITSEEKLILVAQETVMRGKATPVPAERGRGVLLHEFGHAMDALMGLSSNKAVIEAWRAEADRLRGADFPSKNERQDQAYFTLPEPAGIIETVAELFARLHGGRTAESLDAMTYFPETAAVVRSMLYRNSAP
ncbi:MAG: phage minor head protein [Pseudomonadota bacterium]